MNGAALTTPSVEDRIANEYQALLAASAGLPNADALARMLVSLRLGHSAMPERLGLSQVEYQLLMERHFPGANPQAYAFGTTLDPARADERLELRKLFLMHCETVSNEQLWLSDILVAGCMGGNHLWQDLGLWSRKDVSTLIAHNFPELKALNSRDMKWKKFLYKQLCNAEGIYTCRSPSCEVCDDYASCFAPEE